MKNAFPLLPVVATCSLVWGAEQADTHRSLAEELVNILSETEVCLASCQDGASVAAALPKLKELAARSHELVARQNALPAPTVQDHMAAASLVEDFSTLWQAICKHIDRLEAAKLVSPELRDVLKLSPPEEEAGR